MQELSQLTLKRQTFKIALKILVSLYCYIIINIFYFKLENVFQTKHNLKCLLVLIFCF